MEEPISGLPHNGGRESIRLSNFLTNLSYERFLSRATLFGLCLGWIMAVSVHDTVLIVLNRDLINEFEENPLGRWLLQVQGGEVWLFVFVKLFCTSVVTTCVAGLYHFRERIGLAVAIGLAIFQSGLLMYLTFS